jgi:DNA-binding response OmpR family regulator
MRAAAASRLHGFTRFFQRHEDTAAAGADLAVMTGVLLADEDARRRIDVWDRLVEEGYRVEMACDRGELVGKALEGDVDLAILGLNSSEGFLACQELRRGGFAGAVLVVLDRDRRGELGLAHRFGADDALARPITAQALLARVEACLRESRAAAAPLERGARSQRPPGSVPEVETPSS